MIEILEREHRRFEEQSHPQAREIVLEALRNIMSPTIEHHIKEEEGNMFRLARGIFSRDELRMLAARMLKARR